MKKAINIQAEANSGGLSALLLMMMLCQENDIHLDIKFSNETQRQEFETLKKRRSKEELLSTFNTGLEIKYDQLKRS